MMRFFKCKYTSNLDILGNTSNIILNQLKENVMEVNI